MINKSVHRIILWGFKGYVAIAAVVGTVVMAWPFVVLMWNGFFAPAPMPVYLPNGFIYGHDWSSQYGAPNVIRDKNNNAVIMADVRDVMWHGKTVYGFRRGLASEPYYYICTYGEDCSDTQHLTEADFIRMLKEKNLPPYDSHIAQTYDQLLREQSKTDIGKKGG